MAEIDIDQKKVLHREDEAASVNRDLLARNDTRAFDVMGATGSGKTMLIESIVDSVGEEITIGAIAGDVTGTTDYDRFQKAGVPAYNLNTDSKCHLDAELVNRALQTLPLKQLGVVFIENVGNFICPANFPLGVEMNLVVISVTEGEDTVLKQPKMFMQSDALVINKVDIAPAVSVDPDKLEADYQRIKPDGQVFQTVASEGQGIPSLIDFLDLRSE